MNLRQQVEALADAGKKIQAIKEYRTITGLGLKESKEAVDYYLEYGFWRDEDLTLLTQIAQTMQATSEPDPSVTLAGDPLGKIVVFLQEGKKIAAIKELRELTGLSLRDAKNAVDRFIEIGNWQHLPDQDDTSSASQQLTLPSTTSVNAPEPIHEEDAEDDVLLLQLDEPDAPTESNDGKREDLIVHLERVLGDDERIERIFRAKKSIYDGYLAILASRVVYLADTFGQYRPEGEFRYSEKPTAEVKNGIFGIELIIRLGYFDERFTDMSREDADLVADLIEQRVERLG